MTRLPIIGRLFGWLGHHAEFGVAALMTLAAGGLWLFAAIADEVFEGDTHAFDTAILLSLRDPTNLADPIGPPAIEELARDVTALGGVAVLGFLTAAVAGLLWLQRRRGSALFVLGAVGTGLLLSSAAKSFFDRPRPDLVPHGSHVYTSSFPSGHSMMSAITYLTLALLVAHGFRDPRLKAYVVALAVLIVLAVGMSRVYLGVHWPTDVLAGWAAGGAWALFCAALARALARRGAIEPDPSDQEN